MAIETTVAAAVAGMAGIAGLGAGWVLFRMKERVLRAELASREKDAVEQARRDSETARLRWETAGREELARERATAAA